MKLATILLLALCALPAHAAISGGLRVNTDTTGTNTTSVRVTVSGQTNLNVGALNATNSVKVISLTGDRVAIVHSDNTITNSFITVTWLNALSNIVGNIQDQINNIISGNTNNWMNEGATNSTLAGIGKPWALEVTNSVQVGALGEAGLIELVSTNGTYTVSLGLDANGTLTVAYGNTNMLTLQVGDASGYGGAGTKALFDDGSFKSVTTGAGITNININPTDSYLPYRSNATVFGDSALSYTPDGTDAVINLFTNTDDDDADTAMLIQPFSGSPYNSAHIALYVENDVETPAETDFPVNQARVGNNAIYAISASPETNTVAVGIIGTVDPAQYNYSIGVEGVIEVSGNHASSTNFGVVASVLTPSSPASQKSAALYARVLSPNQASTNNEPVMENAVALLESYDSDYPLIIGRTNNGTTTFKVLANGTTTVNGIDVLSRSYGAACSDLTTPLTTGTVKGIIRLPHAMTLTEVRASLLTAQTGGSTFTVNVEENGTTVLSTPITIDNGETSSVDAAVPPVISDSALADDAIITFDIDQVGDGTAIGLQVWIIGTIAP